jgi:hypothetical protein
MKDYSTIPNTSGAFPNVVGVNASGPGETDGTAYIKQLVDDGFGARQAVMDRAGLTPNAADEAVGNSQFLDALKVLIRESDVRIKNWVELPFTTSTDSFFAFAFVDQISGVPKKRWVGVGQRSASTGVWSSRGGLSEWSSRTNPTASGNMNDVIWDPINSLFVAVGQDSGGDANIITSPDGITWLERAPTVSKAFDLRGVASDGVGIIVAVGQADGTDAYIVTSPDGITWTERTNPKNFTLNKVVWSADLSLFCAVGGADGSDAYIITSPDGITWTERTNPSNIDLNNVRAGNSVFVAVGDGNGSDSPYLIRSTDGITWAAVTIPEVGSENCDALTFSADLEIFIGATNSTIEGDAPPVAFFSDDGTSWEVVYLPIEGWAPLGMDADDRGVVIGGASGKILNSQRW